MKAMNFALLNTAGLPVQLHLAGTLTALGIGIVILSSPKGTQIHRRLGWAYVAAMLLAATSSVWIQTRGHFSPIHILTILTYVMLLLGIISIRRGRVSAHRKIMIGLFSGALVVAGLLTMLPGRLMGRVVLGW